MGNCVAADSLYRTELPFSNNIPVTDQNCTSSTASQCPTGKCIEWTDPATMQKMGKCYVYCSELTSMPAVGSPCFTGYTCRTLGGGNICQPNILVVCGQGTTSTGTTSGTTGTTGTTSGTTSGTSGTTSGTTTGSTSGSSTTGCTKTANGGECTTDFDCCSGNCDTGTYTCQPAV
jgi:hypothetical protein